MSVAPLYVYHEDKEIGRLGQDQNLSFTFNYGSKWLDGKGSFPISLSMPLDDRTYQQEAHAYFANLLPEGPLRNLICQRFRVSIDNHYELIKRIGGECAGAIRILPEDADIRVPAPSYQPIGKLTSAEQLILDSLHDSQPTRLSLAGAQYKLPVFHDGQKLFLPVNGAPSSHILKFPAPRFNNLPTFEYFCTRLGKLLGLETINMETVGYGRRKHASLSGRYDRILIDGRVQRLHQEDFCQVLGVPPQQKYEAEGGPSLKDCFDALDKHSSHPVLDRKVLMESTVFNVLIGNCDVHAKNISYLFKDGKIRLSPCYDLVSTLIYPRLATQMAMELGGEKNVLNVTGANWFAWAREVKLSPKLVTETVERMSITLMDRSFDWLSALTDALPEQLSIRLHKRIIKQCRNILGKLR